MLSRASACVCFLERRKLCIVPALLAQIRYYQVFLAKPQPKAYIESNHNLCVKGKPFQMLFSMIYTILMNLTSDKIWSFFFLVACLFIFSYLHYPQCFAASKGRFNSCFMVYYRKRCSRALFFQFAQLSHLLILICHFYKSSS